MTTKAVSSSQCNIVAATGGGGTAARRPPTSGSYRSASAGIENEEPTRPATAKAFPQPNAPVAKAQQPRNNGGGAKAATPKGIIGCGFCQLFVTGGYQFL